MAEDDLAEDKEDKEEKDLTGAKVCCCGAACKVNGKCTTAHKCLYCDRYMHAICGFPVPEDDPRHSICHSQFCNDCQAVPTDPPRENEKEKDDTPKEDEEEKDDTPKDNTTKDDDKGEKVSAPSTS